MLARAVLVFTPRRQTSFFTSSLYFSPWASSSILLSRASNLSVICSKVIRYSCSVSFNTASCQSISRSHLKWANVHLVLVK